MKEQVFNAYETLILQGRWQKNIYNAKPPMLLTLNHSRNMKPYFCAAMLRSTLSANPYWYRASSSVT